MENVLEELRQAGIAPSSAVVDALLVGTDRMLALLDDVERSNEADVRDLLQRLRQCLALPPAAVPAVESRARRATPASTAMLRPRPRRSKLSPSSPPVASAADRSVGGEHRSRLRGPEHAASVRIPVPLVDRLMTLGRRTGAGTQSGAAFDRCGRSGHAAGDAETGCLDQPAAGRRHADPHAAGRKSVRQIPAHGPRSGSATGQDDRLGDDRDRGRVGQECPGAAFGSPDPSDPQLLRSWAGAARRTRTGRQAAGRTRDTCRAALGWPDLHRSRRRRARHRSRNG